MDNKTSSSIGQAVDARVQQQLVRQLKIINFWITFFGTLILIAFVIMGVLIYKVVTFMSSTEQKLSDFQTKTTQTLNVKDDVCKNSIMSNSSFCKQQ